MKRRRQAKPARGDLTHVCPLCRVYDPTRLVHHVGCYFWRPMAAPALVAGLYRRREPRIGVME